MLSFTHRAECMKDDIQLQTLHSPLTTRTVSYRSYADLHTLFTRPLRRFFLRGEHDRRLTVARRSHEGDLAQV